MKSLKFKTVFTLLLMVPIAAFAQTACQIDVQSWTMPLIPGADKNNSPEAACRRALPQVSVFAKEYLGYEMNPISDSAGIPSNAGFTCHYLKQSAPGQPLLPFDSPGGAVCLEPDGSVKHNGLCRSSDCQCSVSADQCCAGFGGGASSAASFGGGNSREPVPFTPFPVDVALGLKIQNVTDWQSNKDRRFQFGRYYRSGGQETLDLMLLEGAGLGWESNWSFKLKRNSLNRIVYAPGGKRIRFYGSTTPNPTRTDEPYGLKLPGAVYPDKSVLTDGTGKQYLFENIASTVNTDLSVLHSILWPDGYEISFELDANHRIESIRDNRSQRAELTWISFSVSSGPDVWVISEIKIDTNYNGLTLDPDAIIEYSYVTDSRFTLGVLQTGVEVRDFSTNDILFKQTYSYDPALTGPEVPLLTAFSDGRLDENNQSFDYAVYDYDINFNTVAVPHRAIETQHAESSDRYLIEKLAGTSSGGDARVINPLGKQTDYSFELIGNRARPSTINGLATGTCLATTMSLDYTPNSGAPEGYVYERVEQNGSRTVYERDTRGLVVSKIEDADGPSPRVTSYTWETDLRLPASRTTSELEETFSYDAEGLLLAYAQKDVLSGSPTLNQTRTWNYGYTTLTSGLKVLTTKDGPLAGSADLTSYQYYSDGTLQSVTDPNGLVTEYSNYDAFGNANRIVQPDGVAWELTYDARGQLTEAIENADAGDDNSISFTYDIAGLVTSATTGSGVSWVFTYDEARRLIQAQVNGGAKAVYDHDAMGNVIRTEFQNSGGLTHYYDESVFDELGRLMTSLGAVNQSTQYRYDVEDNLQTITDAQSKVTTNAYDALNRLVQVTDRSAYETELSYNDADQVTLYKDQRNIETEFEYNGFGDVVKETSPDRGTTEYSYDTRGLVISMTDGRMETSTFSYDNGGRLTGRTYSSTPTEFQSYTYDFVGQGIQGKGKIRSINNQSASIRRAYAPDGKIFSNQDILFDGAQEAIYETQYEFDEFGRLSWMQTPGLLRISYTYDDLDQINAIYVQRQVIDPVTGTYPPSEPVVTNILYKPFGPIGEVNYGDGYNRTFSHDDSYRVTADIDQNGSNTLRSVTYGYTNRDNLSSVTDQITAGNSETFDFNATELLRGATGQYGEISYSYYKTGDRSKFGLDTGSGNQEDLYSLSAISNRLSSITYAVGGSRTLSYDGAGNVVSDVDTRTGGVAKTYTYDAASRMSSYSSNSTLQAEYEYNALGHQVIRRQIPSGQIIHSIYDIDGNRIAEYDYDPATQQSTLLREYIWLNGEAVGVVENGTLYFVRTDYIGRPIYATDGSGTKAWEATYLPFGSVRTSTGSPIALRFPGQWYQSESGLHQNWMRDYDPTTGRYLQTDPLGLLDGPSVYGYARQNPLALFDPTGEYVWTLPIIREIGRIIVRKIILGGTATATGSAALLGPAMTISPATPAFPDSVPGVPDNMCKRCPPCFPFPEWTIGYREDNHSVRIPGIGDHHLNLYRVNQNKSNCACFWNKHTPYHVNPPADPSWVPLPSSGRGPRDGFPSIGPLGSVR